MDTPTKRSHLYLNNDRNANSSFKVFGGPPAKKLTDVDEQPDDFDGDELLELTTAEISAQQQRLGSDVIRLKRDQSERYQRRIPLGIQLAVHLDYIIVHFQQTVVKKLQDQFERRFGLRPKVYFNLNRSVTFSVINSALLESFLAQIDAYAQEPRTPSVPPPTIVEDVFLYITGFELLTTERMLAQGLDAATLSTQAVSADTPAVALEILADNPLLEAVREQLLNYLAVNGTAPRYFPFSKTIEVANIAPNVLRVALDNFDIVHRVQSLRTVRISPGRIGEVVRTSPISITPNPHAPIVGVVDTGVFTGTGLAPVVLAPGYCLDLSSSGIQDNAGHGTAVASLVAIGEQLFSSKTVFEAKARILPIKVIEESGDGCSPDAIAEAIRKAFLEHGVRLFTLCLNNNAQLYNQNPSLYAFILDKLAWEYDLLIFISTGNLNDTEVALVMQQTAVHRQYPNHFSSLGDPNPQLSCEETNLFSPAEALNHVSVGAIAHNFASPASTMGLTPAIEYPAIYTRKSHYDYSRLVNGVRFLKTQANKQLHKPDVVYEGGDLSASTSGPVADITGIEVLTNDIAKPFIRQAGTSFAVPLVASMAAEVMHLYPQLSTQAIKALLLNGSRSPILSTSPPHFRLQQRSGLLERLIGKGKPDANLVLFSDDNRVTFLVEDDIRDNEFKYIELQLPEYWLASAATKDFKLGFTATLCYVFPPARDNHLHYCPLHISFSLLRSPADCKPGSDERSNEEWITQVKKSNYDFKGVSWSAEVKGINNALLSNTQKMDFNMQPGWFTDADHNIVSTTVCLAVRSRVKTEASEEARFALAGPNKFSLVVTLEELPRNRTISQTGQLYDELEALNEVAAIAELNAEGDISLEI